MNKFLSKILVLAIIAFLLLQAAFMQYESAYQEGFDEGVRVQMERQKNEVEIK